MFWKGTFRLVCNGETYNCNRGDVLYIPKEQPHLL